MIRLRKNIAGGYLLIYDTEDDLESGHLVVAETYQVIPDESDQPAGAWCTLRKAYMDGVLITDPARSQRLADAAGIETPSGLVLG